MEGEVEMSSTHSDRISVLESGAGENDDDDDDEVYYTPERRPSLELTPMDTSNWRTVERAASPVLSYTSMGSDSGLQSWDGGDKNSASVCLERRDSFSSCYSYDSDDCEKRTRKVRTKDDTISLPPARPELIRDGCFVKHPSLTVGFTFKVISEVLTKLTANELRCFKDTLWNRYPESFSIPPLHLDMIDLVDKLLECYDIEVTMQLTKYILLNMGKKTSVDHLEERCSRNEVRFGLRNTLKQRYGSVKETLEQNEVQYSVYSPLHQTFTYNHGPNYEHEIRNIEKPKCNREPEKPMTRDMIFNKDMIENDQTTILVSVGPPGSGKSMSVQKFILDWAEERSHEHIFLLFPMPFKDIYKIQDPEISFVEMLYRFYPDARRLKSLESLDGEGHFMFIFDGYDEYPVELDFSQATLSVYPKSPAPMTHLIVNLLRGTMYHDNLIWVTTRPLKNCKIPSQDVNKEVTEVRGFNDDLKDVYFRKVFEDPAQAEKVINHVKSCKTMYIMCHLPLFCSLLRTEFQSEFKKHGLHAELPRTITKVYTQLVLRNLNSRSTRAKPRSQEEEQDFLIKMGKMAFSMLESGKWEMDRKLWSESEITHEEAVQNSGICTEFDNGRCVFGMERIQMFIHSTMQEYMAALYVFLSFSNHGKNVLLAALKGKISQIFKTTSWLDLYKCAVERSLLCEDGRDDIFLRFLMGMAVKTNQELLKNMITSSVKQSFVEDLATFIKTKFNEDLHPDRIANLHHCLEELGVVGSKQASTL